MPPKFGPVNTLANRPIVMRKGHRDYIELDNKKKAVVRVWNAATASWRLTPLGRKWAKQQQSEFVVSIPIIMLIHRKMVQSRALRVIYLRLIYACIRT